MSPHYFVHIIGHAEPLPLNYDEYEALHRDMQELTTDRCFSVSIEGKATFTFRVSAVAMIEERSKGY